MAEHQNIEWKESWRDEYLKWICGFANAQGGTCQCYAMKAPVYDDGMAGLMITFQASRQRLIEALGEELASQLLDGKLTDLPAIRVGDDALKVGDGGIRVGDEAEKAGNRVGDDAIRVGDEAEKAGNRVGDDAIRVGDEAEKAGNRVGDDVVRVGDELTDRQYAILALLEHTPTLTVRALAAQVGISTRKIEANLAKLKAAGYLIRLGTPRSGQWQVIPFQTKPR